MGSSIAIVLLILSLFQFSILEAPPTAELEPLKDGQLVQTDEVDGGC